MDRKTHVLFGDTNAVIIDNGSFSTKIGYSGHDTPSSVVPTIMGVPSEGTGHHWNVESIFCFNKQKR